MTPDNMIEYITGAIAELTPTYAVIETTAGIAYMTNITLPTYTELTGLKAAKLYIHESIREDAWTLYGFIKPRERELFRALIGVSGVGAATASIILSAMSVPDLERVISTGDDSSLKKVKGIGAKTAQRIIIDLKDKITPTDDQLTLPSDPRSSEAYEEAVAALTTLGYQKQASQKALKKLFEADPSLKVESAIKKALAML